MRQEKGGEKMRLMYLKPRLKDLSQRSRIVFVRQFRQITQDELADKLNLNGVEEAGCFIKDLDDDEAVIYMVDSNIYRSKILPSEKAWC